MKKTTNYFLEQKGKQAFSMVVAYDCPTARILDEAGIDMILVGDSLGSVILGYENTLPVTVEDMIYHGKAVCRGAGDAFVVVDMPFMSYQTSVYDAVKNAGRIMKETNCQAVKLEGGAEVTEHIRAIVNAGIPVMGHIGITPQSINTQGGYRVQGKTEAMAQKLLNDAKAVAEAGAFSIAMECVPENLAKRITEEVPASTIGIGAGRYCDGQVLVFHHMIGYTGAKSPKFMKQYTDTHSIMVQAMKQFKDDVTTKAFPNDEHKLSFDDEVLTKLY